MQASGALEEKDTRHGRATFTPKDSLQLPRADSHLAFSKSKHLLWETHVSQKSLHL